MVKKTRKYDYPETICENCAIDHGGTWVMDYIGKFKLGICGWCKKERYVYKPIEWGYPKYYPFKGHGHKHDKKKKGAV